ncbi:MAG: hypothetical protein JST33_08355 [Actinobacteria bacterium]|nr:hypothetical protein [Actinomycetota bacterium]
MSRLPAPLPGSLGEQFTPEQSRAAGVSSRRLRARDIERPYRGVLSVTSATPDQQPAGSDDEPFARDRAQRAALVRQASLYRTVMPAHAFFAGRSAAGIWRLPIDCSGDLVVGTVAPHRAPRRRGIQGRQFAPELVSIRTVDDFRVTSPASTWASLGGELTVRELVRLGDAIVRVPRDAHACLQPSLALATITQLQAAMEAGRRAGAAALREALGMIRVGSASPLETDYRCDSIREGLPEPLLDVEIRDPGGRLLGVTEIAYPDFGLLVEIEGDHHRTSRQQWNRDIDKYADYAAAGWEVVRLTSAHIRGARPRATRIVRESLRRHGWTP